MGGNGSGQPEKHNHDGHEDAHGHDHGHGAHCHHEGCDHDHAACGHDHEHDCDHDHDHEGHEHHEPHEHHHEKHEHETRPASGLRKLFNKVAAPLRKHSGKLAIGSSFLMGTTALTMPLLAAPLGALAAAAAYVFLLDKTSDIALDNINSLGKRKNWSGLQLGIIAGAMHTVSEFLFGVNSIIAGDPGLGMANIVGGTFAHTMLILGGAAILAGKAAKKTAGLGWKFHTAVMTGASALFGAQIYAGSFNNLSVALGAAMMAYGGHYLWRRVSKGDACHGHDHGQCSHDHHDHGHDHGHGGDPSRPAWRSGVGATVSLLALALLSHSFVRDALAFSEMHNVSKALIGIAVTGFGTALPEALITWKAAWRKKTDFALGNVLGCNTTNTLLVGGMLTAASAFMGASVPDDLRPGTPTGNLTFGMFSASVALTAAALAAGKGTVKRWQGAAAVGLYAAYLSLYVAIGGKAPELHQHGHAPEITPPAVEQRLPTPPATGSESVRLLPPPGPEIFPAGPEVG